MLFLIPLFLVLGIMYAFISYELQTKELKWAVDQESRALGHTIQSFAEYNTARYFENDTDSSVKHTPEFELILQRIMTQDRMVRMDVLSEDGDSLLSLRADDYEGGVTDLAEAETLYSSNFEGTSYELIKYQNHALIHISTLLDTIHGMITVNIVKDAAPYDIRISELRRWIGIEIALALCIGLLVSLMLTYFIKIRISTLTKESKYFLKGNDSARLDQGSISEFNDLGSTLNILVNVFHKNMDWYRRSIQQKEQDRTSSQLARFIKEKHSVPIVSEIPGFSITAALTGVDKQRLFVTDTSTGNPLLIWGSIHEKDPLEAALITEAITDFIKNFAQDQESLFESLSQIFGKEIAELNQLKQSDSTTFRISTTSSGATKEVEVNTKLESVKWIHSLGDSITEKIDAYSRHSQALSPIQLFSDVRTIVGHIGSTVIIGIRSEN